MNVATRHGRPPAASPGAGVALDEPTIRALDATRAAAAIYVVLHHVAVARGWSDGAGIVFRFGQEAVIVFFLLSGFVIFASERHRAFHPYGYYLRRLRRIYPILLLSMVVSTLVALDNGDLTTRFDIRSLAGTLVGLQDIAALKPGVITDPYLDNFPLWSLSYELAFYLVFPVALVAWTRAPRRTTHLIGAGCCACYVAFALRPGHATLVGAYFLVWWSGAMAAAAYLGRSTGIAAIAAVLAWLVALAGLAAVVAAMEGAHGAGVYPILPLRHFAFAAAMLVVVASGLGRTGKLWAWRIGSLATSAASISYALYVFHYPLMVQWRRADSVVGLLCAAVMTIVLAAFSERRLIHHLPAAPTK